MSTPIPDDEQNRFDDTPEPETSHEEAIDEADLYEQDSQEPDPRKKARKRLRTRRLIAVLILLGIFWGLWWLFAVSGYADPVVEALSPAYDAVVAMINDPLGVDWAGKYAALAAVLIMHIGVIMFIFDEQ